MYTRSSEAAIPQLHRAIAMDPQFAEMVKGYAAAFTDEVRQNEREGK
jgi:hypothetical protein